MRAGADVLLCRAQVPVPAMPEGDTVWRSAHEMHRALAGRALTHSDFRVPRLATLDVTGRVVTDVVARGKHMLTHFEGGLTLHTHFEMDGAWRLHRTGRRWSGGPTYEIRVVLGNSEWTAVGYRLPVVEVTDQPDESIVGHLGPDLLGRDWNARLAVERLRADRDRTIGEALLDQRNLAGIGNVYKCELLFLRGLDPWTPVADVTDLVALVELGRRVLWANRDRVGHVTTGDTRRGRQHYVYGRGGLPCLRCGTLVRRAMQGDPATARVTYWCPACQPRPENAASPQ